MSFPTGWQVTQGGALSPILYIGELPGRKRIALYIIEGSVLTPLAYFQNREAAETAYSLIERLADALPR